MTVKFPGKSIKNLLLKVTIKFSAIAAIFVYTLSAVELTQKPTSTFKTVMLNGTA